MEILTKLSGTFQMRNNFLKKCSICEKDFYTHNRNKKCCSQYCANISRSNKENGKIVSLGTREKLSFVQKGIPEKKWVRNKTSLLMKEKWQDKEYAFNQLNSIAKSKRFGGNARRGKCGFREDLQKFFRSRWEANFARILNYNIEHSCLDDFKDWKYESKTFSFIYEGRTRYYRSDFYLPHGGLFNNGLYFEIKGWMSEEDNNKLTACIEQNPSLKLGTGLIIIDKKEYKKLADIYREKILWER